jgi:2-polyprenyl-6-methoxyphenol hydroxylase-like FAD-dependent oxidoreductase
MSPVGGVGINYAIQDAVAAANVLAGPLAECQRRLRPLDVRYLAAVQRRREVPTRLIQGLQALIQRRVLAPALRSDKPLAISPAIRLLIRLPGLRALPARVVGFGFWPVRVKDAGRRDGATPQSGLRRY